MNSFLQSSGRQFVQSAARQRIVQGSFAFLDTQQILVHKTCGGWIPFTVLGHHNCIEGTAAEQTRGRSFYITRTTDYTYTPNPESSCVPISYSGARDYLAQGHCPQVSGMPTGVTTSDECATGFIGDSKIFGTDWGLILGVPFLESTLETNDTSRRMVRIAPGPGIQDESSQTLSGLQTLGEHLSTIYGAITSRDWSQFKTSDPGDDLNDRRNWTFDYYPLDAPYSAGVNRDTTGLNPADYSEALTPNNQTGTVGGHTSPVFGWGSMMYPNLKANPALDYSNNPNGIPGFITLAPTLISGWGMVALSGSAIIHPRLAAVRTRFRVTKKACPYFIARSQHTRINGQTYFTGVQLVSTGVSLPGQWVEIPFFTGAAPGDWRVACANPHRMEVGDCYFAVINENFPAWLARTGYLGG